MFRLFGVDTDAVDASSVNRDWRREIKSNTLNSGGVRWWAASLLQDVSSARVWFVSALISWLFLSLCFPDPEHRSPSLMVVHLCRSTWALARSSHALHVFTVTERAARCEWMNEGVCNSLRFSGWLSALMITEHLHEIQKSVRFIQFLLRYFLICYYMLLVNFWWAVAFTNTLRLMWLFLLQEIKLSLFQYLKDLLYSD